MLKHCSTNKSNRNVVRKRSCPEQQQRGEEEGCEQAAGAHECAHHVERVADAELGRGHAEDGGVGGVADVGAEGDVQPAADARALRTRPDRQ